jgi:immune inhibitor A
MHTETPDRSSQPTQPEELGPLRIQVKSKHRPTAWPLQRCAPLPESALVCLGTLRGALRRGCWCSTLLFLANSRGRPPVSWSSPPVDGAGPAPAEAVRRFMKEIDQPNPIERARIKQRLQAQQARRQSRAKGVEGPAYGEGVELFGKSGTDRVLVILVEFAGTNTFTWTPGSSTWDPLGQCDNSEFDGSNLANAAASQFFAQKHGITGPTNFTYRGPLHNEIARPPGTNDPAEMMVWVPDFSPSYYTNIIFGNGIVFDYARQDGSVVHEDHTGKSVRDYYEDLSGGAYTLTGTILGWVKVTNSVWYYGGDGLPGARSCSQRPAWAGAIPGGGDARTLVVDALKSAKAAYPGLDWASFDQDGDGYIDRLWIIHAGLGEEDNPGLLNRTSYGEGGMWSHSWSLSSPYQIAPGVSAWSYIMMPENAGIAVLAHEFGHNLGAMDLYTYGDGQTSAGFWTVMADSWAGFPLGFLPEAMDPMHLDQWGWLSPLLVSDPTKVYSAKLGQASRFPSATNLVRGVKIELPNVALPLPVQPRGQWQWWGGQEDLADARMTLKQALHIPTTGATLEFQSAYDTESGYDYFFVDASTNNGTSWQGLAQFTGKNTAFPDYQAQGVSLASFANKDLLLRFRYTTDGYGLGAGPFVDDIVVRAGVQVLLSDDAEQDSGLWTYTAPWSRNSGQSASGFTHNYYLQWRNTSASGGYDQALGDARFRFGPVNTGLLVWYQDDRYGDNSIANYLTDPPSFGPKGKLLVVDAHPEPYLDPYWVSRGVSNELGVVFSRGSMRDAPFSRWPTADFHLKPPFAFQEADFAGRPAAPQFSDTLGHYPGLQQLGANLWRTWQWDASVVLPSTQFYGVLGAGYAAGTPLQTIIATRGFVGTNELITYRTNLLASGLSQGGADGNPGSVNGHYGWNLRIVHQTNSWAEVVIWNSRYGHLDDDGDGVPNWEEAIAGTDPKNAQSFLRVTRAAYAGLDGSFLLEWPSATNRTYRVLRSSSVPGGFQTVADNLPATPPLNSFRDLNPGPSPEVFYRIQVE